MIKLSLVYQHIMLHPRRQVYTSTKFNAFASRYALCRSDILCAHIFMPQEQRLRPGEEIDMPVFFYIDREFASDPAMADVDNLTLSYTFFKVDEEEEGTAN